MRTTTLTHRRAKGGLLAVVLTLGACASSSTDSTLDAAAPAPAYEAETEAPVPLRAITVMIGVPARRTGQRVSEAARGVDEKSVGNGEGCVGTGGSRAAAAVGAGDFSAWFRLSVTISVWDVRGLAPGFMPERLCSAPVSRHGARTVRAIALAFGMVAGRRVPAQQTKKGLSPPSERRLVVK